MTKKATFSSVDADADQNMEEHHPVTDALPSNGEDDDDIMIDDDENSASLPKASAAPAFAPVSADALQTTLKSETRRIPIPPHRMTPLKKDWINIFGPLTEILGLQVRMNVQRRTVEARVRFSFKLLY